MLGILRASAESGVFLTTYILPLYKTFVHLHRVEKAKATSFSASTSTSTPGGSSALASPSLEGDEGISRQRATPPPQSLPRNEVQPIALESVSQNLLLAFIMLWLIELVDYLVITHVLALRTPYLLARIFLNFFLLSSKSRGAQLIYQRFLQKHVEHILPEVEFALLHHWRQGSEIGFGTYAYRLVTGFYNERLGGTEGVVKQLSVVLDNGLHEPEGTSFDGNPQRKSQDTG